MSFGGGRSSFLSARLRAQETAFTREQDLHAYKSIRDALKGTGQLEAARDRVQKMQARESEGVDILAEVHQARAMANFKEEDLPDVALTMRPMRYAPRNKAMDEHAEFMKHIQPPRSSSSFSSVATGSYNTITRGRYEYLNEFLTSMEVQPEERRPMSKREIQASLKQFNASKGNVAYIAGSFVVGTSLCVGAAAIGWYVTKTTMGVSDTKGYAEKMRQDLPATTDEIQKGAVGVTIQRMKSGLQESLDGSPSYQNFKRRNTFEGMVVTKTPSGTIPDVPDPTAKPDPTAAKPA